MATQFSAVGSRILYWSYLYNGYSYGTNLSLATGADIGMGRLLGVKSLGLPIPQSRNIAIEGDNGIIGALKIATGSLAEGELVTSVKDPTFVTGAQSLLINSVNGLDYHINGIPCPTYRNLCFIENAPAQNDTSGSLGQLGWSVTIYLSTQVQPRDETQIQNATAWEFTHDILASYADKFPWGEAISNSLYGATRALKFGPFYSPYPYTLHTFIGDGTATTFTVDETPAGAGATYGEMYDNGAAVTYGAGAGKFTVVAATKTVTFGTAPVSGHICNYFYQFQASC